MRRCLFLLLFIPCAVQAQLDRFNPQMNEAEFIKAYPEATRDYEAESFWMNAWDTIEGTAGNSMWRIVADSVNQYSFRSLNVDGPSYRFPAVDSGKVVKMRNSARLLEAKLEKFYGKPNELKEQSIVDRTKDPDRGKAEVSSLQNTHMVYFAKWNFSNGQVIIISLSAEIPLVANIDAPGFVVPDGKTAERFELTVTVTRSSQNLPWKFHVGRTYSDFHKRCPRAQAGSGKSFKHVYSFADTELSGNATWIFVFENGSLMSMQYYTAHGLHYNDASTEGSYSQCKYRAEKLLAEGQQSLGKPDSMYNSITPEYNPLNMETKYQYPYLYAEWRRPGGTVYLIFDELGGGKEGIRFSVRVFYPEML
jgi:hypothetical protein